MANPVKPSDFLVLLLSPTRFAIERFADPKPIRAWNWVFRAIMAIMVTALWFSKTGVTVRQMPYGSGYALLWLFPFSRINELWIGFYGDAIQRYKGSRSKTNFTPIDRLELLVGAYFEVAVQFGILYFCALPDRFFSPSFQSIVEAVYFSVITITTVGYGDIHPQSVWAQITCMYELAVGFTVIIFALGLYLATSLTSEKDRLPPS